MPSQTLDAHICTTNCYSTPLPPITSLQPFLLTVSDAIVTCPHCYILVPSRSVLPVHCISANKTNECKSAGWLPFTNKWACLISAEVKTRALRIQSGCCYYPVCWRQHKVLWYCPCRVNKDPACESNCVYGWINAINPLLHVDYFVLRIIAQARAEILLLPLFGINIL